MTPISGGSDLFDSSQLDVTSPGVVGQCTLEYNIEELIAVVSVVTITTIRVITLVLSASYF